VNAQTITVRGKVINTDGTSIVGATVAVKGTHNGAITDNNGIFALEKVNPDASLVISSIGYQKQTVILHGESKIKISLKKQNNKLDQTVIIAYGSTTKRLSTGDISTVTGKEIERQPVSNPLAALEGRVPGMVVTQSNGLPGSSFNIQIRGRSSLKQGTQPLYIVDGIPYMLNSSSLAQITSPLNQTPFNSINPSDIESIEVLKDADATSIYGSQGANGVILITTKNGVPGKTTLNVNYYAGIGDIGRTMDLLNTSQYLQMRREAFANDNVIPTAATAPDLLTWDTSRYTNWKKLLIGGKAHIYNLQLSLSGGSKSTQFLLSANDHKETTVFPDSKPSERGSVRLNLNHFSSDKRFKVSMNIAYSIDSKKMPLNDLTSFIYLPPNSPSVYDSSGELNWAGWPSTLDNPMSYTLKKYHGITDNLISSAVFQYKIFKGFIIKTNLGYNYMELNEQYENPIKAQRPSQFASGTSEFATNSLKSWIVEPQLTYKIGINKSNLELLIGMSWQNRKQQGVNITGSKYKDDDLLGDLDAAGHLTVTSNSSQYKYTAAFGRLKYNLDNKYILNINVRRDGSSRFGPAKRFANFSDIGAAWIFTSNQFVKSSLPFLTYGKIRSSYGITGNDQIGDYQYLDAWNTSSFYNYQGVSGILPNKLFNASFEWERDKKFELGIDLGFFDDDLLITTSYYRNRSDNQLVYQTLPSQTGFPSILKNLNALIQNSGWEVEITSQNIQKTGFSWQTNFNITIPRNKLLKYPNLNNSADKYQYVIGKPLHVLFAYQFKKVDSQTGIYQFDDLDKNDIISSPNDLEVIGEIRQKLFGGMQNNLTYKHWQLNVFFQYVNQTGRNYLSTLSTVPGAIGNQPTIVLNRWQSSGDRTEIQKFTEKPGTPAYSAYNNFKKSSAIIQNASFLRLKNLSISYNIPNTLLRKGNVNNGRVYVEAQNLLTFTNYQGSDPETQSLLSLPPLRILTVGLQLTL
jgi:TonB-linked SusC/RagA family outer membrane protein